MLSFRQRIHGRIVERIDGDAQMVFHGVDMPDQLRAFKKGEAGTVSSDGGMRFFARACIVLDENPRAFSSQAVPVSI